MQNLINQLEALGLTHVSEPGRSVVNTFINLKTGDKYKTYNSGYVRRIYVSSGYFSKEQIYLYQINKTIETSEGKQRILIQNEADRLQRLIEVIKKSKK